MLAGPGEEGDAKREGKGGPKKDVEQDVEGARGKGKKCGMQRDSELCFKEGLLVRQTANCYKHSRFITAPLKCMLPFLSQAQRVSRHKVYFEDKMLL